MSFFSDDKNVFEFPHFLFGKCLSIIIDDPDIQ